MSNALERYLEYYSGLKRPRFGVLVAGPWGSGKTFQVRKALEAITSRSEFRPDPLYPETPIWVSLYGVETPTDLDAAIVAASDKTSHLGIGGLRLIGNVSRGIGGFFAAGAIASELARPILRRSLAASQHRILILDDLERCQMQFDVTLGTINHYVEDMGFRTIIIAHDWQIEEKLATRKEKLIGQTLRISPNYDDAFDAFLEEIEEGRARKFVDQHREDILSVFRYGKIYSLRILRHVIFDVARLYPCLTIEQLEHKAAILQLIQTFSALNALVREGALNAEDLEKRSQEYLSYQVSQLTEHNKVKATAASYEGGNTNQEHSRFELVFIRFKGMIDAITSDILDHNALRAMLVDGIFDQTQIQHNLSLNGFFLSPLEQRSWWRVWHRRERDDDEVLSDIQAMEQDFSQRRFVNMPDILHMFGLRLSLANEGLLPHTSQDDVVKQSKGYLSDLLKEGRLQPATRHKERDDNLDISSGSYGLGYSGQSLEATKENFAELFRSLLGAQQQALQSTYGECAEKMVSLVQEGTVISITNLSRELIDNDEQPGRYKHLPIFSDQSPQLFFDALMNLKGSLWVEVQRILASRYYGAQLYNGLDDEIDWILGLMDLVKEAAADTGLPAVKRFRLRHFADTFNTEHIESRKTEIEKQTSA